MRQTHGPGHTDNMTSVRFLEFLLFLLLHQVYSEEAELTFKAEGSAIEMGYCFGVDYIVVYRSAPEGDQLLGNSSADDTPVTPSKDLQGRININRKQHLLGLQISNLTHMDSGIYRRECWQNQIRVSRHIQQLFVCDKEEEPEEIVVKKQNGELGEVLCNSKSIGLEGTSVRWYYETYPTYAVTLFLDSSVSLDPLLKELHGLMEVRDSGASLLLNNSLLQNNQNFYCLVIKGEKCLSFQNMYPLDFSDSRDMFASQGDRVELHCPSEGNNQHWETPLSRINGSSEKNDHMYISFGDKSEDFSLVIPSVSDEHSGDYSCISSSLELQYVLVLCPKTASQEKLVFVGKDVLLDCDVGENDFQRMMWYRQGSSGDYELLYDSNEETVAIPEDLRGRLTVSDNDLTLTISPLEEKDRGVYLCVVLGGSKKLEEGDDYEYAYDVGGNDTEHEYSNAYDDSYWPVTQGCSLKQETILSFVKQTRSGLNSELLTTTEPPAASNVIAYAIGGGLVGLLVVGVTVAVIAIKRRTKASPKRRDAASRSGPNTTNDIKMDVDPGCTERLTHNDEYGA